MKLSILKSLNKLRKFSPPVTICTRMASSSSSDAVVDTTAVESMQQLLDIYEDIANVPSPNRARIFTEAENASKLVRQPSTAHVADHVRTKFYTV
jgi:hypothetical protein